MVIFFDLDATLLNMDQDYFLKKYFEMIVKFFNDKKKDGKKILDAILKSTYAVIQNDGSKTNEKLFFEIFNSLIKEECIEDFNEFYDTYYDECTITCKDSFYSRLAVEELKKKGYKMVIATNPIFPRIAVEKRIKWAGLDINDFMYVTSYETERFCKPNINFYKDLKEKLKIEDDILMVGNDVTEDMCSSVLGFKTYLILDNVIMSDKYKYDNSSTMKDFVSYIKEEL